MMNPRGGIRPICKVPACGRPCNSSVRIGLCSGHWQQQHKGQELRPLIKKYRSGDPRPLCSFPCCGREVKYWGLCDTHAAQKKRGYGLFPIGSHAGRNICEFPGCGRFVDSHGLCAAHDNQRLRGTATASRIMEDRKSMAIRCSSENRERKRSQSPTEQSECGQLEST
jgi:hypothetical protein